MSLNKISIKDLKSVCDFLHMNFDEATIETGDWLFDIIVSDNTGNRFGYNSLDEDHRAIFIERDPNDYDSYSLNAILEVQNRKRK